MTDRLPVQLPKRSGPWNADAQKLEIPSTFYADRYHISNKETMLNMQTRVEEARKQVQAIQQKLEKIETIHSTVLGKGVLGNTLLESSIKYFEEREANASGDAATLSNAEVVKRLRLIAEQLEKRIKG